ncbi:GNAT family N-acetyltransferase [Anaeroselena agilis]|uniref:GNAT family N-acetyltransferase n=1 Tax=Anaeroselena agilis TaxID=3063788 RepID=A0ABU3P4J8_9FIRM|nr:GNAT family N-acetyltransferase [Selenomonadales bacterium 4137-cl]
MDSGISIRAMTIDDYPQVYALWAATAGLTLGGADSRASIGKVLARNEGFSFVAERNGREIVGALLCGHDGRRGCLYHLAVAADCRRAGLGRALVAASLASLKDAGIERCHLFVNLDNPAGASFWRQAGFTVQGDVEFYAR